MLLLFAVNTSVYSPDLSVEQHNLDPVCQVLQTVILLYKQHFIPLYMCTWLEWKERNWQW